MWTEPPDTIRFWHLGAEEQEITARWFGGELFAGGQRDGRRSVLIPREGGRKLKIKGAGFDGREVSFGQFRRTGPKALSFDFEGRVSEDVASGHDAAQIGAASFQQAATEWQVSARLQAAGVDVLPCLGYGRITRDAHVAWFSVFDWLPGLLGDVSWPVIPAEPYIAHVAAAGAMAVSLALEHGVIGYPWFAFDDTGRRWLKDLHPFRLADPVNMSQLTWVMQLFHALHIIATDTRLRAERTPGLPADAQVAPFRALLPEVTVADHKHAITRILMPYMLNPAPDFTPAALEHALMSNRITASLMQACPKEFARFS